MQPEAAGKPGRKRSSRKRRGAKGERAAHLQESTQPLATAAGPRGTAGAPPPARDQLPPKPKGQSQSSAAVLSARQERTGRLEGRGSGARPHGGDPGATGHLGRGGGGGELLSIRQRGSSSSPRPARGGGSARGGRLVSSRSEEDSHPGRPGAAALPGPPGGAAEGPYRLVNSKSQEELRRRYEELIGECCWRTATCAPANGCVGRSDGGAVVACAQASAPSRIIIISNSIRPRR
jgi:hypothetical protein